MSDDDTRLIIESIYEELTGLWPKNSDICISRFTLALRIKDNWFWIEQLQLWWEIMRDALFAYQNHLSEYPSCKSFPHEWEGRKERDLSQAIRANWNNRPRLQLKGEKV